MGVPWCALTLLSLQDSGAGGEHTWRRPEQPRRLPGLPVAAQGLLHGYLGLPVLLGHRLLPVFPAQGQALLLGFPSPTYLFPDVSVPTTHFEGCELEGREGA